MLTQSDVSHGEGEQASSGPSRVIEQFAAPADSNIVPARHASAPWAIRSRVRGLECPLRRF
jgi:hypothetical protein